jgi:hypothetical protein
MVRNEPSRRANSATHPVYPTTSMGNWLGTTAVGSTGADRPELA